MLLETLAYIYDTATTVQQLYNSSINSSSVCIVADTHSQYRSDTTISSQEEQSLLRESSPSTQLPYCRQTRHCAADGGLAASWDVWRLQSSSEKQNAEFCFAHGTAQHVLQLLSCCMSENIMYPLQSIMRRNGRRHVLLLALLLCSTISFDTINMILASI